MMKQYHVWKKRIMAVALVLALLLGMVPASTGSAAKKVSLSKKKMTIKVGKKKKLKLKNNKKKVKWKVISGKKKIKLKNKKKNGVTIVAKKKGKAKVQAKIGKKKYTCKITVKGKSASGSGNGGGKDSSSTSDSGKKPGGSSSNQTTEDPTKDAGKNIDLKGKTAFTIGSRQLALGISKDDVKTVLGVVTREEKSPQGFDVIVYNPGNTYNCYTLVYLKDNVVVSICAVATAGMISYGNLVTSGDKAETLASAGWKGEEWYKAKDGEAKEGDGAYKYQDADSGANILAFVDYYRQNTSKTVGNAVYCIQVYSSAIDFDDMTKPAKCTYSDDVVAAMEKETAELLIAYRTSCGFQASQYPKGEILPLKEEAGLTTVARAWLSKCAISDTPPAEQNAESLMDAIITQNMQQGQDATLHYAQITMAGNADSIGFANSVLELKKASSYIATIKILETDAVPNYQYCYQYFGVAAAGRDKNAAAMVIDLVDRWYDSDQEWK